MAKDYKSEKQSHNEYKKVWKKMDVKALNEERKKKNDLQEVIERDNEGAFPQFKYIKPW